MKPSALIFSVILSLFVFLSETHAVQLKFTPSIGAGMEFNDNIYLDDDNEEDDFITKVFAGMNLEMVTDQSTTLLSYTPAYEFYDQNDDLNAWEHKALFTLEYRISPRTTFTMGDSYLYTENPFKTFDVIEEEFKGIRKVDYTIRRDRKPYTSNASYAGLSFELSKYQSMGLFYNYQILKNDDPEVEDSERHNPSLKWTYKLSPRYTLDTGIDYTRGDFEERESFGQWKGNIKLTHPFSDFLEGFIAYNHELMDFKGDEIDYMIYEPKAGFSYKLTKHTNLSLGLGYFFKDNSEGNDGSDWSGDFALSSQFEDGSIQLGASAGQDVAYFGSENLGFNTYWGGNLNANYRFLNQLSGSINGTYRKMEYTDEDRDDTMTEAGASLTYVPFRKQWLALSLSYLFRMLDSTDDENDYQSNRLIFQITLSPGRPYIKNF